MADFFDDGATSAPAYDGDVLDALVAAAEEADSAYGVAVNALAEAENAEDRAFFVAMLQAGETHGSAAAREQHCRSLTVEQRAVRRIKEAAEKAARKHLDATLARLSATQTKYRSGERQT